MTSSLLKRIRVTPPYLALHAIELDGDEVTAMVRPELPLGDREVGPLSSADVGRHLAILGSLAVARGAPDADPRYYLAHQGRLRRLDVDPRWAHHTGPFRCRARTMGPFGMSPRAVATLEVDGVALYRLEVTYRTVSDEAFGSLFLQHHRDPVPAAPRSPFLDPVAIEFGPSDACDALAVLQVTSAHCSGHFDAYPALPVACLASAFGRLANHLVARRVPSTSTRFMHVEGWIEASRLAFCGSTVELSATHSGVDVHGRHEVRIDARCEGEAIAGERLLIRLV